MAHLPLAPLPIDYPCSNGLPIAESDFQRVPLIYAVEALGAYFADRPDVYVSGNMFIYYEKGNPQAVVAPDVFVVMGAPKRDRRSYKLWEEPKGPDFVLEITSRSTRSEDQGPKRGTYAFLGVREYWQYDPTGDYLDPPLQGYGLMDRNYEALSAEGPAAWGLHPRSEVLGLELRLVGGTLRFHDPATGRSLLSYREIEQAHREVEQARREAEQTRREAERVRGELEERLRQEMAARRAAERRLAEREARHRSSRGGASSDDR